MKWLAAIIGWLLERFGRKAQVVDDQAAALREQDELLRDAAKPATPSQAVDRLNDGSF